MPVQTRLCDRDQNLLVPKKHTEAFPPRDSRVTPRFGSPHAQRSRIPGSGTRRSRSPRAVHRQSPPTAPPACGGRGHRTRSCRRNPQPGTATTTTDVKRRFARNGRPSAPGAPDRARTDGHARRSPAALGAPPHTTRRGGAAGSARRGDRRRPLGGARAASEGRGGAGRGRPPSHLETQFSSTELLPALCPPTTAICGRSSRQLWPSAAKASCSRLTSGMSPSIPPRRCRHRRRLLLHPLPPLTGNGRRTAHAHRSRLVGGPSAERPRLLAAQHAPAARPARSMRRAAPLRARRAEKRVPWGWAVIRCNVTPQRSWRASSSGTGCLRTAEGKKCSGLSASCTVRPSWSYSK